MDNKQFAKDLRESARKHMEGALRVVERFYATADAIDPPPKRPVADRPDVCRCDVCGLGILGRDWDGEPCEAYLPGSRPRCPGSFRSPDPEPATDRAGNPLGVSLTELAAGRAIADFRAEGPDHDAERENHALDALVASALLGIDIPPECIASTYRGGAR